MKKHIQKGKMKNQKGITLLALVITIIVLLILAGITISAITGDNGIIGNAEQAKEETEIANEKEIIEKATVQAMGNNKYGNIEESELQSELDKETGEGKTEATDIGDEFEVVFIDSNRYYTVDKDGNVGEGQEIIKDKNPGDITTGKDGETLDGSEEHPYEIWCIEDLIEWSQNYTKYQNNHIILCKDLNFKSRLSYADSENTSYGDINEDDKIESLIEEMQIGIGFTPIANFSGIFNGNHFEIQNIYIVNNESVGLFSQIDGAMISNLGISGYIESKEITSIAGGTGSIVGNISEGRNKKSHIENCSNSAIIKGFLNENYTGIGGIIGKSNGAANIVNCSNEGTIISEVGTKVYMGENAIGTAGILGYTRGDKADVNIYNSYNIGNISSNKSSCGIMGGIWAEGSINIENCFNIGEAQIGICKSANSSNNIYYLDSASSTGGVTNAVSIAKDELVSEEFINLLNDYIEAGESYKSNWKKWKLGEEGYPIFE